MKRNMGIIDRTLRFICAFTIACLYLTNVISGAVAFILLIIALLLLISSFVGISLVYKPLKISTRMR